METAFDCLPCFFKQAIKVCTLIAKDDKELIKNVIYRFSRELPKLDLSLCPPALAGYIYGCLSQWTQEPDPFAEQKKLANAKVLQHLPRLETLLERNKTPLALALHLAVIGNYIDAGIDHGFDWEEALDREKEIFDQDPVVKDFASQLGPGTRLFILGDNAGEIALDTLLVKEIKKTGTDVTYVVRGQPIINDATLQDAQEVGMTRICQVISSGVDTPGTVLDRTSQKFRTKLHTADLILSKGQGNFEALQGSQTISEATGPSGVSHSTEENQPSSPLAQTIPTFFAFKVKCKVVAQMVNKPEGSSVFIKGRILKGVKPKRVNKVGQNV